MSIVYRNAGAWGAGKGARLTSMEVDGNFHGHELRITELEENPPSAVSISAISVSGNQITILLTDFDRVRPFHDPDVAMELEGRVGPAHGLLRQRCHLVRWRGLSGAQQPYQRSFVLAGCRRRGWLFLQSTAGAARAAL